MAGETIITLVGNLTDDPELRFTPSGAPVANFRVASTPRTFDRQSGEWKDGEALFLRCNIWRQAAENVAESLTRGARVVVQGRLKQRSFETKEGEKRTVVELAYSDDPSREALLWGILNGHVTSDTIEVKVSFLPLGQIIPAANTKQYDAIEATPLAVARGPASRLRSGGDCRRLRGRGRCRHFGADRADVLRRLARSPRARKRRSAAAAALQGLHGD